MASGCESLKLMLVIMAGDDVTDLSLRGFIALRGFKIGQFSFMSFDGQCDELQVRARSKDIFVECRGHESGRKPI